MFGTPVQQSNAPSAVPQQAPTARPATGVGGGPGTFVFQDPSQGPQQQKQQYQGSTGYVPKAGPSAGNSETMEAIGTAFALVALVTPLYAVYKWRHWDQQGKSLGSAFLALVVFCVAAYAATTFGFKGF